MLTILHRFSDLVLPFSCTYTFNTLIPQGPLPQQPAPEDPVEEDPAPEEDIPETSAREQPEIEPEPPRLPVELPVEIWLEIFEFATYVHKVVTIVPHDPSIPRHAIANVTGANTPSMAQYTKLALMLVSKAWRNLALPLLYRRLEIRSLTRGQNILKVLRSSKTSPQNYGQWTRHMEIYTFVRGADGVRFLVTVYEILKLCPKLSTFSGNWMHPLPPGFLNGVSRVLGLSLDTLYWNETKPEPPRLLKAFPTTTPDFLGSFQSLRTLDLRLFVGSNPSSWSKTFKPTLPFLRNLVLSTRKESLTIAAYLLMPSLHNLTLQTLVWNSESETMLKSFLKMHGSFLITIDLATPPQNCELETDGATQSRTQPLVPLDLFLGQHVCPNLETFTFPVTSPISSYRHPSLRHIGLRGGNMDGMYPDKPSQMRDHLLAIKPDKYPKLELIQIVGFLVEAHTDSLIKDIFIWWAEHFEKEMGVTFLDGEGVLWAYDDEEPVGVPLLPAQTQPQSDTGRLKHCD